MDNPNVEIKWWDGNTVNMSDTANEEEDMAATTETQGGG